MPKKLDEIHDAVKRNLKGKINPRTKKPYTESEMWAIAQAQYKKTKSFSFYASLSKSWEGDPIEKAGKTIEKGNQRFVEVIVSGLETDRENERMSQEAITDMIKQFKSGTIPFFFDHGIDAFGNQTYPWKGIGGVWVDAHQEGDHLKAVVRLNRAHPDHELFWKYLKEDVPVGFSVAGMSGELEDSAKEPEVSKAQFNCECIKCGYKLKSSQHCADIKCPKCNGKMRRAERPGPGR